MNNNKPENLLPKILEACTKGELEKVKELISQFSFQASYGQKSKDVKNIFINSCISSNIELVKFIMDHNIISEYINYSFITNAIDALISRNNPIDHKMISYILNENKLTKTDNFYSSLALSIRVAIQNDDLFLFKTILNLNFPSNNNKKALQKIAIFKYMNTDKEFNIFKYLYSTPELKNTFKEFDGFKFAYENGNKKLLSFLILDYKIEKNKKIEELMDKNQYEDARRMFNFRELNSQISDEINSSKNTKKIKI